MGWLVVIGVIAGIAFLSWVFGNWSKAKNYDKLKTRINDIEARESEFKKQKIEWERKLQQQIEAIRYDAQTVDTLAKEKSQGFPWLAKAYSDYFYLQKLKEANYLQYKSHPAPTSAEKVRNIARERRAIEEKLRIAQGIINYY